MRNLNNPTVHAYCYLSDSVEPVADQKWFLKDNAGFVTLEDYNHLLKRYHRRGKKIEKMKAKISRLVGLLSFRRKV